MISATAARSIHQIRFRVASHWWHLRRLRISAHRSESSGVAFVRKNDGCPQAKTIAWTRKCSLDFYGEWLEFSGNGVRQ